jgi:hypothetical protein
MATMHQPDDDPLEHVLAEAREERARYDAFLEALRESDPAFAEASALQADDMSEWQAAVYLLTGSDQVWAALAARVLEVRSVGPVVPELANPRRAWSGSEEQVMLWAAHFWDVDRHPARFPYEFEGFLFRRWVTALHLRKTLAPPLWQP